MAEVCTDVRFRKVNAEKLNKWFFKKAGAFVYESPTGNGELSAEVEGGYAGFFWESLALQLVCEFEGIVFDGCNQFILDDHIVKTVFRCDGSEIALLRSLEVPTKRKNIETMLALWETEAVIPYEVKFSVEEILCYAKIQKEAKKRKDPTLAESLCAGQGVSFERFSQFATILNFKKR